MFQLVDINQTSNTSFSTKDNMKTSSPFRPSSTPSSSASSFKSDTKIDISSYDDFGVNSQNGFLPSEPPLERLQGQVSEIAKKWESLLDQAQQIPLMLAGGGPDFEESKKIEGRRWRREIREMETLDIGSDSLLTTDVRFSRRAHVVLSFLSHFYIHSQPPSTPIKTQDEDKENLQTGLKSWNPFNNFFSNQASPTSTSTTSLDDLAESNGEFSRTLPSSLAVPWQALSKILGIPPVLTYATTVLWNYTLIDSTLPLSTSNVKMMTGFTNSKSEDHFYKTSLLMEIEGREVFGLMRDSLFEGFDSSKPFQEKVEALDLNLKRLKTIIEELTKILHNVRSGCDPSEFYWGLRPWFRGADSGIPEKGWIFKGVKEDQVIGKDFVSEWTGPSAGQSSLIHSLDIFLDVDHTETKPRTVKKEVGEKKKGVQQDGTFMGRMLLHMPREHRNFLRFLRYLSLDSDQDGPTSPPHSDSSFNAGSFPNHPIRTLALKSKVLSSSYDDALMALKSLRDEHMRIATLYIITQSRASPPSKYAPLPINFTGNLAYQLPSTKTEPQSQPQPSSSVSKRSTTRTRRYSKPGDGIAADALNSGAKGTGGTELTSFLRDCRNHTLETVIGEREVLK